MNSRDPDLGAQLQNIMQTVIENHRILWMIAENSSGQFTARRLYELATPRQRRQLERYAPKIHKPELRELEKFKASLIPADLDFPQIL